MTGLIPAEELKRLQKRMNRLKEDLGLSSIESKYLDEMERMQKRMGELMEDVETSGDKSGIFQPLADVSETDGEIVVTMDLPGIDKKDVDIAISENELSVVATREKSTESVGENYHRRERTHKKFERTVSLPAGVKMDAATARLNDGVLSITLPKEVITARKRIAID